jgi:hypothetical protein
MTRMGHDPHEDSILRVQNQDVFPSLRTGAVALLAIFRVNLISGVYRLRFRAPRPRKFPNFLPLSPDLEIAKMWERVDQNKSVP